MVSSCVAGNACCSDVFYFVTPTITARLEVFSSALKRFCVNFTKPMCGREGDEFGLRDGWQTAVAAATILARKRLLTILNESTRHGFSGNRRYSACHLRKSG